MATTLALLLCATAAPAAAQQPAHPHDATHPAAQAIHWMAGPDFLPKGARMAVVSGDPSQAGQYEIRLDMPNGYRIPPHSHPADEQISVLGGTFRFGMGDTFDMTKLKTMRAGAHATAPAGQNHYVLARGRTRVSVTGMGPFAITYANPHDDPRGAPTK